MKTCTRCGFSVEFGEADRWFNRGRHKDGLRSECKACQKGDRVDQYARQKSRASNQSNASVAQSAERLTCNQGVAGSIPAAGFDPRTFEDMMAAMGFYRRNDGSQYSAHQKIADPPAATGGLTLVIPDLHAPQHDPDALGAVLSLMRSHTFDEVVLLGDAAENVSCSWFGGPEALRSYKGEAAEARRVVEQIRSLHSGRMTLTTGNHDRRADQKLEKAAPQLVGSVVDEIGYQSMGIDVIPEDAVLTRGRIKFIHGHQTFRGPNIPTYHARVMADLYGMPGWSVVYGHTHRSQVFTRRMDEGPTTAYGLGCLERKPHWQKGVSGWTQEIAVAHVDSGHVQPIRIVDGSLWFGCQRFTS